MADLIKKKFTKPKHNPPFAGDIQMANRFRVEQKPVLEPVKEPEQMEVDDEIEDYQNDYTALQIKRRPATDEFPQIKTLGGNNGNSARNPKYQSGEQNVSDNFAHLDDFCFVLEIFHRFKIRR
jgi:t-SNARE complex subunit (syntaxin)